MTPKVADAITFLNPSVPTPFAHLLSMLICAARLNSYIQTIESVKVNSMTGHFWRSLSADGAFALAGAAAIFGIGSPSRLKFCQLDVTEDEAEAILDKHARANSLTPGARLVRSQPSQSVVRSIIPPQEDSRVSHAFITFRHVGQRRFRPADRNLPTADSLRLGYDPTAGARNLPRRVFA